VPVVFVSGFDVEMSVLELVSGCGTAVSECGFRYVVHRIHELRIRVHHGCVYPLLPKHDGCDLRAYCTLPRRWQQKIHCSEWEMMEEISTQFRGYERGHRHCVDGTRCPQG
jgi:hypothetical protein